jgi:mRNA interferase MazF
MKMRPTTACEEAQPLAATSRFSFGDVVLVPFPFTDQSGTKKRPAVVDSSHGYKASRRDIVIMAITSC